MSGSTRDDSGSAGGMGRREFVGLLIGLLALVLLALRLVWVQGLDLRGQAASAEASRLRVQVIPARRGEILDRTGAVLARSIQRYDIAVDQTIVQDLVVQNPDGSTEELTVLEAIRSLADILGMPDQEVKDKLQGDADVPVGERKNFEYLFRDATPEQWSRIEDLRAGYVTGEPVSQRSYPNGSLAGSVVGFVGGEGEALGGIELTQDEYLRGIDGERSFEIGADGVRIPVAPQDETAAQDGSSIELSLDRDVQFYAQQAIARRVEELSAEWGTAIVMRISDGAVLALADSSMVDPNDTGRTEDEGDFQPRSVASAVEPGSTQKILTAAAAIDTGNADKLSEVAVPSELEIDGQTITDAFEHEDEDRTFAGIIADSMNTGTVLVGSRLDRQGRYDWMKKFGVGELTGIELPGESPGLLPAWEDWDIRQQYTVLFGQGVSQSPLRTATIFQAVGNDGLQIEPRLLQAIIDPDGTRTEIERPEGRQIFSAQTAEQLREMMESVITVGGAPDAATDGYRVGGKSGTAEAASADGGYDGYTTSFAGIGPMEDPQFVVAATVHKPQGAVAAIGASAAFSQIMGQVLRHYGVQPSTGGAVGLPKFYGKDEDRNEKLPDTPTGIA
ncbi:peptidoglycan D,D-transpeptidase FtsI family protein [Kocuria palustris]|uniref:peptidoglycan D,D-transpeptidase FtsI family protein n=1 Tax=Kocuria palustris TaxID=71999 RepID=UPI000738E5D7|nr:penicillin-binding protein 2 [Kocuria palustris]KUG52284.1 peptidoglycan glycosyltransferase [Kocuria palustris]